MNTKDINNLIEELNKEIEWWVKNKRLFCGGCCWSAYLLARGFERLGIKYSTIVYQGGNEWNTNRFSRATNGDGCGHVAISVIYKHKRIVIGSDEETDRKMAVSMNWGGPWMIRKYSKVSSEDLWNTYMDNDWNYMWDISFNSTIANKIEMIFKKYE